MTVFTDECAADGKKGQATWKLFLLGILVMRSLQGKSLLTESPYPMFRAVIE
jgi:hypothetical protein